LVNINAYHQPGVEAGKLAAGNIIEIQRALLKFLEANQVKAFTAEELAKAIGKPEDVESVYKVARHLSANGCEVEFIPGPNLAANKFGIFE
jgi:glucose-6-phosphate isomerase